MAVVGSLVVPVSADPSGLKSGFDQARADLKGFAKDVKSEHKDLRRVTGLFTDVSNFGGLVGGLAGGPIGGMIGTVAGQIIEQTGALSHLKQMAFNLDSEERKRAKEHFKQERDAIQFKLDSERLGDTTAKARMRQDKEHMTLQEVTDLAALERNEKQNEVAKKRAAVEEAQSKNMRDMERDDARRDMDPIERKLAEMQDKGLIRGGQVDRARVLLQRDEDARQIDLMAERIAHEWKAQDVNGPVAAMAKDSAAEFSLMAKHRRELDKMEQKDPTPDEVRAMHERMKKDDDIRKQQLDDIKKALKDPPIKQVRF